MSNNKKKQQREADCCQGTEREERKKASHTPIGVAVSPRFFAFLHFQQLHLLSHCTKKNMCRPIWTATHRIIIHTHFKFLFMINSIWSPCATICWNGWDILIGSQFWLWRNISIYFLGKDYLVCDEKQLISTCAGVERNQWTTQHSWLGHLRIFQSTIDNVLLNNLLGFKS